MLSCNRLPKRGWLGREPVDPRRAYGSTRLRSVNRRVFPPGFNHCFPIHQSRTNLVEMHQSQWGKGSVALAEKLLLFLSFLSLFSLCVCASRQLKKKKREKLCKLYSGTEETSLIIYPRIMSFREIRALRGRGLLSLSLSLSLSARWSTVVARRRI